jgi:hypothetical protein
MAIVASHRDGRQYYYYKVTGGESIYLGTLDKPKREAVLRAHKLFLKNKVRILRDDQIFETLLKAAKANDKP